MKLPFEIEDKLIEVHSLINAVGMMASDVDDADKVDSIKTVINVALEGLQFVLDANKAKRSCK